MKDKQQILEKLERAKYNRKYATIIFSIIVSIVLLGGLILDFSIVHQQKEHINETALNLAKRNSQIIHLLIDEQFAKMTLYSYTLYNHTQSQKNQLALRHVLSDYMSSSDTNADAIAIIDKNGKGYIFTKENDGKAEPIDANGLSYYKLGIKNHKSISAFHSRKQYNKLAKNSNNNINNNFLLFALPISSKDEHVCGVLAVEISLDYFMKQIKIPNTLVYFIDSSGNFLFTDKDYNGRPFANLVQLHYDKRFDMPEKVARRAIDTYDSFTFNGKFNNVKSVIAFSPVGYNDWEFATVTPLKNFYAGRKLLTLMITLSFLLILCLLGAAIFIFINKERSNELSMTLFMHDYVTGCKNKSSFIYEYNKFVDKLKKNDPRKFALIVLDIDKFRTVNMVSGFEEGNRILREIFSVIEKCVDKDSIFAKYQDDRYGIFFPYYNENDLTILCDEIEKGISEIKSFVKLIPSFGIYKYTDKDFSVYISEIAHKAEMAKNQAKGIMTGKNKYAFYDENIEQDILREKEIEDSIADAIKNEEIKIYLKSCYVLKTGKRFMNRTIFEWQSEKFGIISEEEFLPIFEKNGYALELDKYTYKKLSITVRNMLNDNIPLLPVSRPLSKFHFNYENFAKEIARIMEKYNVPKELVQLEIPQSAIEENQTAVIKTVEQLHNKGYKISLNNYGFKNSPDNILIKCKPDMLVIDQVLFRNAIEDKTTKEWLKKLILLIHTLGTQTMITGIKTKEEADFALELDCDFGSGSYFSERFDIDNYRDIALEHKVEYDFSYKDKYENL